MILEEAGGGRRWAARLDGAAQVASVHAAQRAVVERHRVARVRRQRRFELCLRACARRSTFGAQRHLPYSTPVAPSQGRYACHAALTMSMTAQSYARMRDCPPRAADGLTPRDDTHRSHSLQADRRCRPGDSTPRVHAGRQVEAATFR
jgi:hypothetical protein